MVLQVAILAISVIAFRRSLLRGARLTDGEQLALGSGILSFFLLVGLPAIATGQPLVNLAVMVALGYMAIRLRRRNRLGDLSPAAPRGV